MAQDAVVELLAELVAIDTTSHRSNLSLITFVEDYLSRHGVDAKRITDHSGHKANLYATIGPPDLPGLMLSGHTDTVPVTGQAWTLDPFALTEQDGRLYGRGTTDMKGFLAAVLAAVPAMVKADLAMPFHLAFSHDEEVGCLGVRTLLADLAHQPIRPAACLVGEPTSMRLATAHKGKLAVRVHLHGKACHSGLAPQGVNAIHAAAHLVTWLEAKAATKASEGTFDARFAIPYTTLQVGTIQGGTALNIVPQDCQLDLEFRNVPADSTETLLGELMEVVTSLEARMQQGHPQASIRVEPLSDYPGLSMTDDDALVGFILDVLEDRRLEPIGYGTEGGLFQQELGIPTIVCGPGSMAQGHQPDEFVTREQLAHCEAFLARLIRAMQDPQVHARLATSG
ncbi:acetylornithine deacetylase [Halomonas sp. DP8Y7-3]|uniref:acetylornithine deacetylase n=1 Tax=Halomonas sp. DP8Y7-3 TaxID=2859079 RepID=UPI001C946117|nr:acetylornithine deacetylase [Halomonas sp. DP8Y7-3]MBY5929527.1 acetylornithine deacetylase [Halomonas sp. DP8Y7-3]